MESHFAHILHGFLWPVQGSVHHSHSVKTQLAPLGGCHVAGSINPRCLLYNNSIILRVLLAYELSIFTMYMNLYEFAIVFAGFC